MSAKKLIRKTIRVKNSGNDIKNFERFNNAVKRYEEKSGRFVSEYEQIGYSFSDKEVALNRSEYCERYVWSCIDKETADSLGK